MLLIKCRLKKLITLDSNDYTVLFTDQIFINSLSQNTQSSSCFNTHGREYQTLRPAFQTLGQAFEALRENKKLVQELEKVGRMFVLQHGPCCPNQPRYSNNNELSLEKTTQSANQHLSEFDSVILGGDFKGLQKLQKLETIS